MGMKSTEAERKRWSRHYFKVKHDPDYVRRRKARHAKYRKRHTFQQLAKAQRKSSDVDIPKIEFWRMCLRQKCRCPLTGQRLTKENISVDHIIPKSKGGSMGVDNLRLVTKDANLAKHTLLDEEFVALCRSVVSWHDTAKILEEERLTRTTEGISL